LNSAPGELRGGHQSCQGGYRTFATPFLALEMAQHEFRLSTGIVLTTLVIRWENGCPSGSANSTNIEHLGQV